MPSPSRSKQVTEDGCPSAASAHAHAREAKHRGHTSVALGERGGEEGGESEESDGETHGWSMEGVCCVGVKREAVGGCSERWWREGRRAPVAGSLLRGRRRDEIACPDGGRPAGVRRGRRVQLDRVCTQDRRGLRRPADDGTLTRVRSKHVSSREAEACHAPPHHSPPCAPEIGMRPSIAQRARRQQTIWLPRRSTDRRSRPSDTVRQALVVASRARSSRPSAHP